MVVAPDAGGGGGGGGVDPAAGAEMWPLVVLLLLASASCGEWPSAPGSAARRLRGAPMDTMCGLRPGWPHGALEKVAPARDARALRALTRTWGGPSG